MSGGGLDFWFPLCSDDKFGAAGVLLLRHRLQWPDAFVKQLQEKLRSNENQGQAHSWI